MILKPNILLGVKVYMNVVNNSGEFGCEIIKEGLLNDIYYDAASVNAACGVALYQFLKDNCRYWNPQNVRFRYFEEDQTTGVGILEYEGDSAFYSDEDSYDLLIQFYPKNFDKEDFQVENNAVENEVLLFDDNVKRKK